MQIVNLLLNNLMQIYFRLHVSLLRSSFLCCDLCDLSLHPPLFQEPARHRGIEGGASPQGYPFYLPIASPPRGYSFPSSMFISQNREKQVSPEPSLDGQLACRWMKVNIIMKTKVNHCTMCQYSSQVFVY